MPLNIGFLGFVTSITLGALALHCVRFGVAWLVMKETGSATAFAAMAGASSLVEIYAKPLVAPMADHFDRLVLMRLCMLGSFAAIAALWTVALFMPFSIVSVTLLLTVSSLVAALRDPTAAALIPSLVAPGRLMAAQSLRSTLGSTSGIAGAMIGALLLSAGGVPAAMTAGAGLSIVALMAMLCVATQTSPKAEDKPAGPARQSYLLIWHVQVLEGFRAVLLTRAERQMAVVIAITNAGLFPFFAVAMPLWVARDLAASPSSMAAIEVAFSAGILIASAGLARVANAALGRHAAMIVGNAMLGTGLITAAACTRLGPIIVCMLTSGIGFATFNLNASTLRATATPFAFRARMAAGVAFLSSCMNPFATQAFGALIDAFDAATAVATSGALVLTSTALLLRNADLRSLLSRRDEDITGAYERLYPNAFPPINPSPGNSNAPQKEQR